MLAFHRFFTETENLVNYVFRFTCGERSDRIEKFWNPVKNRAGWCIQTLMTNPKPRAFDSLAIEKEVSVFAESAWSRSKMVELPIDELSIQRLEPPNQSDSHLATG